MGLGARFLIGLPILLVAKKYNIPIIYELNDATFIDRIRELKLAKLATLIEKYIFVNADALLVVTGYFRNLIIESGIPEEKIFVMPNAANPNVFSTDVSSEEVASKFKLEGKTVIGYTGSLASYHGMEILFELIEGIVSRKKEVVFLIVGDYKKLGPNWLRFIENNNDKVKLVGTVSHNEIPKYIAAMDIAVLPNSNSHGSPMKIFEYMVMGKAVVAPRLPPLKEVVTDGVDGLLFTPNDKIDLKNKIIQLIDNEDLRMQLGRSAKDTVKAHHTWDKNIEKILSIYNDQNFSLKTALKGD